MPKTHTRGILDLVADVYPGMEPAEGVLQTSLQNANPIIHPAVTLCNAARIEMIGGDFLFYEQGVSDSVGRLIEALDNERIAIGEKLGITIRPDPEMGMRQGYMLENSYGMGDALVRAVFSRPLKILLDPWLLGAGFHLLDGSLGTAAAVLAAVLAALGVVVTAMAMRALVQRTLTPITQWVRQPIAPVVLGVIALTGIVLMPANGMVRPALFALVQTQSGQVRATLAERQALLARAASQRMQAKPILALAYWRDTDRLRNRYPESLAYSLEAVYSWAARDLPDDALLIVLGDHQAAPLIIGHDAGADVPVHMISSDTALLSRLADGTKQATREGLALPRAELEYPGLEALRFILRAL